MFFVGKHPGDDRLAMLAWRHNAPNIHSLEPLAHFTDDQAAQYFWSLLEQLLKDAAATGETGLLGPPGQSAI